ncbi:MAG: lysophospholipid acyltransferase family protein [Alphaproteobacteria bacterium]
MASISAIIGLLPLDVAGKICAVCLKYFGQIPLLQQRVKSNILRAFPNISAAECTQIANEMWENLGYVVAEYVHMEQLLQESHRFTFHGAEHLENAREQGAIFFSGHFANWEIPPAIIQRHGLSVALVYRAPNNPYSHQWLLKARNHCTHLHIPKGKEGAKTIVKLLRDKKHVGMLIDQKMNDGIAVPFFGEKVMTAPAIAQLAMKYNIPLYPVSVQRLQGSHFDIIVHPPITLINEEGTDKEALIYNSMCQINGLIEGWIKEKPGQWLWLHRRWPTAKIAERLDNVNNHDGQQHE